VTRVLRVAGVDEAGRGPLAGPVMAAAVILDPARPIVGLADSKTLRAATRERLAAEIRARALAWAVVQIDVDEIDRLNIHQATLLAMRRAVAALRPGADAVLVDGNVCPVVDVPARAIVGGDASEPAIAAASILAKTARDAWCVDCARDYPLHGFDRHKGYGTRAHVDAMVAHGVTPVHRRSFAPVRAVIAGHRPAWGDDPGSVDSA
jgi:ribonuclease HII